MPKEKHWPDVRKTTSELQPDSWPMLGLLSTIYVPIFSISEIITFSHTLPSSAIVDTECENYLKGEKG